MTAEIICVGTELLLGNIVNTNAAYLAEKLAGDNVERLAGVLKCAMERSDVILLSGGLGPTEDDLTKETVAEVCGKNLSVDDHSMERIAEFFAVRDIQPTENNWKQAMVPEGAKVLDNDNGTAPGIILETEKNRIVLLPGPPAELVPMFEGSDRRTDQSYDSYLCQDGRSTYPCHRFRGRYQGSWKSH